MSQVLSLFGWHQNLETLEFAFYTVTDQLDGSSCLVHAIANAIVFCNYAFRDYRQYILSQMRPHLVSIIENGEHTELFPEFFFNDRALATIKRAQPVFCYCRLRDNGSEMYECNRCFEWLHTRCLKSSVDPNSLFYCDYCYERRRRVLFSEIFYISKYN